MVLNAGVTVSERFWLGDARGERITWEGLGTVVYMDGRLSDPTKQTTSPTQDWWCKTVSGIRRKRSTAKRCCNFWRILTYGAVINSTLNVEEVFQVPYFLRRIPIPFSFSQTFSLRLLFVSLPILFSPLISIVIRYSDAVYLRFFLLCSPVDVLISSLLARSAIWCR